MEPAILKVDLQNPAHCSQLINLLNDYMNDPMGNNRPMPAGLGSQIIAGTLEPVVFCFGLSSIMPRRTTIAVSTLKSVKTTSQRSRSIKRWVLNFCSLEVVAERIPTDEEFKRMVKFLIDLKIWAEKNL